MKIVAPKSITHIAGNRAVLLLHGFTGSTVDVRRLAKQLHKLGYTCHAPLYPGHGVAPEQLIETEPSDWWQATLDGYEYLQSQGYDEMAVVGVSLGGVFSLRLGAEYPVKGIVSMCAPALEKSMEDLQKRVLDYAQGYKKLEGKNDRQIQEELIELKKSVSVDPLKELQQIIMETREKLNSISTPTFVLQGSLDEPLYHDSARIIYERIHSDLKQLKWYKESGHIITLGDERETVYHDIADFLDTLDW